MRCQSILIGVCAALWVSSSAFAGPADLSVTSVVPPRIIKGADVSVEGRVYNVAPPGSNDLNYSVDFTLPDSSTTTPLNRTKTADGGADYDAYQYDFDSTGANLGANNFSVNVSDPAALHSPQSVPATVQVLNHAVPAMWINGTETPIQEEPAQEPSVDPLAFGATGGGESFAASAPNIIGDPLAPTADLDFDSFSISGDPQITMNLHALDDIVADDSPTAGEAWSVFVDGSTPGHYTKYVNLFFSDEDIPGANAENSIEAELYIDVTVTESGVTGFLEVLPEPASATVIIAAMATLGLRRKSRRTTLQ